MSYPSSDTTDSEWRTADPDASVRHDLLSSERRRLTLEIFADDYSTIGLETLATTLASRETEDGGVDEEHLRSVKISLHHAHLPRLDDADVVDYDPETRRIDPHADHVDTVLSARTFL